MSTRHPDKVDDSYYFRSATPDDRGFLFDMLVEAVNWDPRRQIPRSAVVADPVLARYIKGWPRSDDLGVVAVVREEPVGAAWLRLFTADDPGYGFVADDIPELSMGVVEAWRRRGIGRALLREIDDRALSAGHRAISLSVERANFVHHLYTEEGYQVVERGADSVTMVKELHSRGSRLR